MVKLFSTSSIFVQFRVEFAEIMDFGYPQNLSPEILKLYITQEGVRSPFSSKVKDWTSVWCTVLASEVGFSVISFFFFFFFCLKMETAEG